VQRTIVGRGQAFIHEQSAFLSGLLHAHLDLFNTLDLLKLPVLLFVEKTQAMLKLLLIAQLRRSTQLVSEYVW